MRRIITLVLILTCLGSLASLAEAQGPSCDSVSKRLAYNGLGRVVIRGGNLLLVTQVLIGGTAVPIVQNTGVKLSVEPGLKNPGFEIVELRGNFPSVFCPDAEFTPTVTATRNHPAVNRMQVVLHGGDVGTYQVQYSYRQLMTPQDLAGVYFHRFLNMSPSFGGILATGTFADATTPAVVSNKLIPVIVGLVGQPLYLQAQCSLGAGPTSSFTNLFTIPGL